MTHAERIARFNQTDLYVVITEAFCAGRSALDVLDAVLQAGVTLIQFREKDWPDDRLYDVGLEFRKRTQAHNALLIVDDRIDIALAINADGVHLGQNDLPLEAARRIAPELLLGSSSHNLDEALAAQDQGASYINVGPIFDTQTKSVPSGAIGPQALHQILPNLTTPTTCMGGIKAHNIQQVLENGAKHPAVVTAVTAAKDPQQAAKELREIITKP